MYYFFSFLLAVSLGTIIVVVARKFPQLAHLDVGSLQVEIESQKKKQILRARLEEQSRRMAEKFGRQMAPLKKIWGHLQLKFRMYVGRIERLLHHEQRLKLKAELIAAPMAEVKSRLDQLVSDGYQALGGGNTNQAEEFFITAIKLDAANPAAYRGLGDTYLARGAATEAMETYAFVLKLAPADDATMVKMGELSEATAHYEQAIEYYQQAALLNDSLSPRFYHLAELLLKIGEPMTAQEAVLSALELEPKNPKYLDLLIETAILAGDRAAAISAWQEFRLINPENQKLGEFKERIDKM